MADEPVNTNTPAPPPDPKVMCYVSKEMVPLSQTVEVTYGDKAFRVLAKYVRFPLPADDTHRS
ncbi:MAG: hypothetical protein JW797_18170 [Bradymonadales bacterium]|nr:hypothetical protein [Bradymonadales bacterium]